MKINIWNMSSRSRTFPKAAKLDFGGRKPLALDDRSVTVNSVQIFGFLGGNGAGKTTTIKILM